MREPYGFMIRHPDYHTYVSTAAQERDPSQGPRALALALASSNDK